MSDRKIIHIDMDAFYASVEQRDRPHLRGKPIAVGGSAEGRGVIATASYEARAFGVRSAMSSRAALRLCPHLILLPTDFSRYRAASRQFMAILQSYADAFEPLSLDEAYLDVSQDLRGLGTASDTATAIRAEVHDTLDLTCSAGVSSVKFVAKIASGYRKPNGQTVVPPQRILSFIHPLAVRHLWGVGPATAARLEQAGLRTIRDVALLKEIDALRLLGGLQWWRMANGIDPRGIGGRGGRKSRSAEETFATDVTEPAHLYSELRRMVERLVAAMQAKQERARTLTIKVRYADFETISRSHSIGRPSDQASSFLPLLGGLLEKTEVGDRAVRLVGAGFSNFDHVTDGPQLRLPFNPDQ